MFGKREEAGMSTIALFGAAGNMGNRISRSLRNHPEYTVLYVEAGDVGQQKLRDRDDEPTPAAEAIAAADTIILAIPDTLIGDVAADIVPIMNTGAMLICLDPAAPYAGHLPERDDVTYFVTHPAHPPIYNDEQDMEARRDFFGSGLAKQALVSALIQGPESSYDKGEAISVAMFGPVLRSHRVTLEQMTMLEPLLSETVAATCVTVIREAMDEAISRGVPPEAARDFLLGHINIELAICFDELDWDFSAGAKKAIEEAKKDIFQPDWKKVFEESNMRESVNKITGGA
jgi:D-apionate oxidoisomerase